MTTLVARTTGFSAGMNDSAATAGDFSPGQCSLMINFRPDFDGSAVLRGGTLAIGTVAALATKQQVWKFQTTSGAEQLIAAVDTVLKYSTDGGSSWSNIATGLTAGYWSVTTFRQSGTNYFLLVNGSHAKSWDGTTLANIANIPSGVKYIESANGRVWAGGHAGNFVVASKIADFSTWAIADGGLQIQVGSGEIVTALAENQGRLLVFKDRETSFVGGYGEDDLVVLAGDRGISGSIGCPNFRTIAHTASGGVVWWSRRGLEFYNGALQRTGLGVQGYLSGMNPALSASEGFYYPDRDEYWLTGDQITLRGGVAVNMTTGASWRLTFGTLDNPFSPASFTLASYGTSVKPYGLFAGVFCLMEYGHSDNGYNGIASHLESPIFDYGQPAGKKRSGTLRVTLAPPIGSGVTAEMEFQCYASADKTDGFYHVRSSPSAPNTYRVGTSSRGYTLTASVQTVATSEGAPFKVSVLELEASPYNRTSR